MKQSLIVSMVLACAAAASAFADVVPVGDTLRPGQSFEGDVPAGEPLRFAVELAKDSKLRLKFSLKVPGSVRYLPANFQRVSVIGPDGAPVGFNSATESVVRYDPVSKTSTFWTKDWPVPTGGVYTFTITHRANTQTRCVGSVRATRERVVRFDGDENLTAFVVPMQPADRATVTVTTKTGTGAYLASYTAPGSGFGYEPSFTVKKKVARLRNPLFISQFGNALFSVGYLDPSAPTGTWKATVKIRPGGPYAKVGMYVGLPSDVPLQVRNPDGSVDLPWATSGVCGVDYDGTYALVTAEVGGAVLAKLYNADLSDPGPFVNPIQLASGGDLPGNQAIGGHRLTFSGGYHYLAFSSANGSSAAVVRWPASLAARSGFSSVVDASATPVNDLFLATDGLTVSVGVPAAPYYHDVYQFSATTLQPTGPATRIGDAARPQSAGSAAAYRFDQNVFEFWTPTLATTNPGTAADLQHALYSPSWVNTVWDGALINDPAVTETMCSSVVIDPLTGASIVHYIEPTQDSSGFGYLHRRLFDAAGREIRDSHTTVGVIRRRRPAAFLSGGYLWLATEGLAGPNVTRYQLLQH